MIADDNRTSHARIQPRKHKLHVVEPPVYPVQVAGGKIPFETVNGSRNAIHLMVWPLRVRIVVVNSIGEFAYLEVQRVNQP